MSIDALMTALLDLEIHIHVIEDNKLRVTNASALTNRLRDALRQHKEQIVHEMRLPLFDYALMLFPGVEVTEAGEMIKPKKNQRAVGMTAMFKRPDTAPAQTGDRP